MQKINIFAKIFFILLGFNYLIRNTMKKIILLLAMGAALTTQALFAQVPSYVPTNGLVGYWPFNGNANDESGNGNNGTVNGATLTTDRFGNSNSAYYFNLFDFIQTDYLGISGNNERTISFWIKNQYSNRTINPLNYGGGNSTYGDSFFIRLNRNYQNDQCGCWPTTFEGAGIDGAHLHLIYSTVTGDNNWHNYVYVVGSSANNFRDIKIYRDGILISNTSQIIFDYNNASQSLSLNTYTNPSYPLTFGKSDANISSAGSQLDAAPTENLDDIGMWNRALTQQEITNLYNSSLPQTACLPANVPTSGLVGYWPFCGNANDESGNGNNGTNNGATLTADRFGNADSAYSFDGNNTHIDVPSNTSLQLTNNYTISGWFNANIFFNTNISDRSIVSKVQSTGWYGGYEVMIGGLSNDITHVGNVGGNNFNVGSTGYNINTWYMFTATYNGSIMNLYMNGVLVNSQPKSGNLETGNLPLRFGMRDGNFQYFNGEIDDIGIWNRALTQQEITNLYNVNQCITNITVTDTLIINVGQLSFNDPVTWANNITIAPNPASSQININFNNITNLNGGTLKIINSLGQEVATTPITTSGTNSTMQLATWGGTGMYFVQIINPQGQIVDIKKIILQ